MEALLSDEQTMVFRSTRFTMRVQTIRFLTADLALADESYEIAGAVDAEGKAMPTMQGLVPVLLRKQGDAWKTVAAGPK